MCLEIHAESMLYSMLVIVVVEYEAVEPLMVNDYSIVHSLVMSMHHRYQNDCLESENYVQLLLVFVAQPKVQRRTNVNRTSNVLLVDRRVVVVAALS